jgi:hypothetical protein
MDAAELIHGALTAGRVSLMEWQSKALLRECGIPVPGGEMVDTAVEAAAAAERLGQRVAMKAVGPQIQHKTEGGLVILEVDSPGLHLGGTYSPVLLLSVGAAMRALDRMEGYRRYVHATTVRASPREALPSA